MIVKTTTFLWLVVTICAIRPAHKLPSRRISKAEGNQQLDDSFIPAAYELELVTRIDQFSEEQPEFFAYDGIVKINITAKNNNQTKIVLHKHEDVSIKEAEITTLTGQTIELTSASFDQATKRVTLISSNDVLYIPQQGTLTIKFSGKHSDDSRGFYRSSYIDEHNNTRWLITTQFEAFDARRAFPCFDEPKFKALFTVTIKVPTISVLDGYHALSNMPLDGPPAEDGTFTVYKFQKSSKKMSTYLVAFVVSDFAGSSEAQFDAGTKIFRTWGRKDYINAGQADIIQIVGPAALNIMKNYTNTHFGLPKVDQVGVPDLSFGAMENWGICIYREKSLFSNQDKSSLGSKQNTVTTTVHELAHQWFGDLVTLYWWSDIWLNEGFATFFEYHATDLIRNEKLNTSEWNILGQMLTNEVQAGAMALDAEANTRALHTEVNTLAEIDANFDNIAYSKGGSVLRMWLHVLGETHFKSGLNVYMQRNSESVGTPERLFDAFKTNAADLGEHIDLFIDWVNQPGFPVVKATREGSVIILSQERFFASSEPDKSKWEIPITYTTSDHPNFTTTQPMLWMNKESEYTNFRTANTFDWFIINLQQTGYYRVNYDVANWETLMHVLLDNHHLIHQYNRAQILDDSLWMARATRRSYTPYYVPLNITKYLKNERELVPWQAAINGINFLYWKLATTEVGEKFKTYVLELISPTYNELGLENANSDSYTTQILRPLIASRACQLGDERCISDSKIIFDTAGSLTGPEIAPDVKSIVICSAVRQGDQTVWNRVKAAYDSTNDNADQTLFLAALGCSKDENILTSFLNMTLSDEGGIRKQDRPAAFAAVYNGNPESVTFSFLWLQHYFEDVANNYGGALDPIGGLLVGVAARLGSDQDLTQIKELRDKIANSDNPLVEAGISGAQTAVDLVSSNNAWLKAKLPEVSQWLNEN